MMKECALSLVSLIACNLLFTSPARVSAQSHPSSSNRTTTSLAAKRQPAPKATRSKAASYQLEPKALEILKAAGDRLATARTVSFVAVETFETLSRQGAPLVYANKFDVTLQRPDKLRVILSGDGPASEFYYDGKRMMAYSPAENAVAVAEAPPTIDKALEAIYRAAAIYFPFTDLIVADPAGDLISGLKHAYTVGQSHIVGGTTTDIVAFNGDGVFVQTWVGTEDKLPRAIHAIYLDDPNELRHNLVLSNWRINGPVTPDLFTSSAAAGAKHIEFAHPNPGATTGARPPARMRPPANAKPSVQQRQPGS